MSRRRAARRYRLTIHSHPVKVVEGPLQHLHRIAIRRFGELAPCRVVGPGAYEILGGLSPAELRAL